MYTCFRFCLLCASPVLYGRTVRLGSRLSHTGDSTVDRRSVLSTAKRMVYRKGIPVQSHLSIIPLRVIDSMHTHFLLCTAISATNCMFFHLHLHLLLLLLLWIFMWSTDRLTTESRFLLALMLQLANNPTYPIWYGHSSVKFYLQTRQLQNEDILLFEFVFYRASSGCKRAFFHSERVIRLLTKPQPPDVDNPASVFFIPDPLTQRSNPVSATT